MRNQILKLSKPRPLLPIIPISFTMLANYEKTNVPLYNRNNEVIGKKDDFKINVCHIYEVNFYFWRFFLILTEMYLIKNDFKGMALLDANYKTLSTLVRKITNGIFKKYIF